jgi:hypothetical protein
MSRPKRNQAVIIAGVILTLCISAAALKRYRASAAGITHNPASEASMAVLPASNLTAPLAAAAAQPLAQTSPSPSPTPPPPIQTLRVWMYGLYLYPRTIYAQPGPTTLQLNNQTGLNASLALTQAGSMVTTVDTNSAVGGPPPATASGVVTLSPGSYVFYDMNHPAMTGVIVVGSN